MIALPTAVSLLAILAMLGALALVPLGIPGVWIMLAVVLGGVLAGAVAWTTFLVLVGLNALAEILEFGLLRGLGARYGGSVRAFWGAVAGGFLGLFVGLPIPLVGPLITGFVGTFVGAAAVTWYETRSVRSAGRVGWGVLLARTAAVALKTAVGIVVLAVAGTALFF